MKRIFFFAVWVLFHLNGKAQLAPWNYALQFDGVDDHVSIPHNDVFNVTKTTIEMWFYWEATTSIATQFLIGKGTEQLEIHTGYQAEAAGPIIENSLRFIPSTGLYFDTDANVIQAKKWHHVAFVYDPGVTYKCYIDGVEKNLTVRGSKPTTTAIHTTTDPLLLGQRYGDIMRFGGMLDEVRIWNTVRTQAEIQSAMYSKLAGNESGLVAYYQMSDGSGTSLTDDSPNTNTGTLVNGTTWVGSPVPYITWTGATSNDWNTASNWTPAVVPTASIDATVPSSGITNYPVIASGTNATVNNLTINSTAANSIIVNIGGKLTVSGSYTAVGGAKIKVGQ
ncbi:MAG: hypothetical protein PHP53_07015 [Prolixibacteraceae bacterium]|nr:hypothetical protein [Prolixibacteraceae bacterium]